MNVERSAPRGAVFLSYASQDTEAAKRIADALRAAGVVVWFDQSELVGGDAWDQKIRRQIKECALLIPVISANTQARHEGYFRLEWRLADQRTHLMGKSRAFILPVCIDDTRDEHADVPDSFVAVQWTRLARGAATNAFCAHVKALLELNAARSSPSAPSEREVAEAPVTAPGELISRRRIRPILAIIGLTAAVGLGLWFWRGRAIVDPSGELQAITAHAGPSKVSPGPGNSRQDVAAMLARVRTLTDKTDAVRGELDTASGLLDQAAKLDSTDANVWAEWALVDRRYYSEWYDRSASRVDALQRHATQAFSLDPTNPRARFARAAAMVLLNKDAKPEAIALLESVASAQEVEPGALVLLANLKYQRAQPEAAFGYLDRAARSPPWTGRVAIERAWAYAQAGDWEHAIEMLDRGLATERSASLTMLKSFFVVIWRGDFATAKELNTSIPPAILSEDLPASARYWGCLWARDYEGAYQALKIVPRDYIEANALPGPTGYYRGYALARAGKLSAAKIEWQSALEVVNRRLNALPNDRILLEFKAVLLHSLGDSVTALEIWRSVDELFGDRLSSWADYFAAMEVLPEASAIDRLTVEVRSGNPMGLAANLRLSPNLDRLRTNPRFIALLAEAEADPRLSPKANRREIPSAGKSDAVAAPDPKSVVVLPFANLSGDPAQEYFSDGLTEEILNALARERDLHVVPRTSAFSFRGKNVSLPEIAKALNVAQVIEGSVQQAGKRVRIRCTLTRIADGFAVALPAFDRELKDGEDIFALEDEVARAVVEKLTQRTTTAAPVAVLTKNSAAYDAYLRGRVFQTRGAQFRIEAADRYKQAVTLDPAFALAWARLAEATFRDYSGLYNRSPELIAKSREAIDRALTVEPDLSEALIMRANWRREVHGDFDAARRDLQRAEAIQPATAELRFAQTLLARDTENWPEALRRARETLELDPLNGDTTNTLAVNLYWPHGDFVEADRLLARAMAIQGPSSALPLTNRAVLRTVWRGSDATLQLLTKAPAGQVGLDALRLRALVSLERIDEAKLIVNAMEREAAAAPGGFNALFAIGNGAVWAGPYLRAVGRDDWARQLAEEARSKAVQSIQHGNHAPYIYAWLVQAELTLGHREAALSALEEWRRENEKAPSGFRRLHEFNRLAIPFYAALGRVDEAAALLRECAAAGYHVDFSLRDDIRFLAIRADPRLQSIIRDMESWAKAQPGPNEP